MPDVEVFIQTTSIKMKKMHIYVLKLYIVTLVFLHTLNGIKRGVFTFHQKPLEAGSGKSQLSGVLNFLLR